MNVSDYVGRVMGFRASMESLIKSYNLKTIKIQFKYLNANVLKLNVLIKVPSEDSGYLLTSGQKFI